MKITKPQTLCSTLLLTTLVAGCAKLDIPYKIDIDQGNRISQAQVQQLSLGMSKEEVTFLLGTPLLNDPFNLNRWDYMQYHKTGRTGEVKEGILILTFENNILTQIDNEKFIELPPREALHYD